MKSSIALATSPASNAAPASPANDGGPAIIVLGRDDAGKSHASWFDAGEAELARKAAGRMGMAALSVATDELRGLAGRLPHGRVFASGKAFVPFVKGEVYGQLVTHLSGAEKERFQTAEASKVSEVPPTGKAAEPLDLPSDWSKIKVGSVVVACESKDEGWWVALVTQISGEDLYTLRWRDFPGQPVIVRKRKHVALLHPEFQAG
ncbi:MAG TPA: hypothetical protein VGO22_20230 [Pseudorhizobium sp.]|jgi:hypothetical protein|nr:hypothetical protein [Pseudorhizobium sp.]